MFNSIMKKVNRKMAGKKEAFTLVEILVVILIIGLLFVFLVPKISSATDKARETGIKTDFHSYQVAFESVVKECSGLGANATTDVSGLIGKINGYLDPALKINGTTSGSTTNKSDPWNNNYVFLATQIASSNDGIVGVYSTGKDSTGTTALPDITLTNKSDDEGATFNASGDIKDDLGIARIDADDDNYVLATAYIGGVQYTATKGFSTEIKAN